MRLRSSEFWTLNDGIGSVVPKPVLTRLETLDDRVPGRNGMFRGMLTRGRVTAAHVAAECTPAEVKPPSILFRTVETAITAGGYRRINQFNRHVSLPSSLGTSI